MPEEIYKKLTDASDDLQDAILSCLENLNLLEHCTPDELGMTDEEIITDRKKEFDKAERWGATKKRIDYWIKLFDRNEITDEKMKELLQEFPDFKNEQ